MITRNSRYASCVLFRDGSDEFFGFRNAVDRPVRPDDRFHKVVPGDRIDLLAHRYFGNAKLWWVICDYNDIAFPLSLEEGQVLSVPSVEHVKMMLG